MINCFVPCINVSAYVNRHAICLPAPYLPRSVAALGGGNHPSITQQEINSCIAAFLERHHIIIHAPREREARSQPSMRCRVFVRHLHQRIIARIVISSNPNQRTTIDDE